MRTWFVVMRRGEREMFRSFKRETEEEARAEAAYQAEREGYEVVSVKLLRGKGGTRD